MPSLPPRLALFSWALLCACCCSRPAPQPFVSQPSPPADPSGEAPSAEAPPVEPLVVAAAASPPLCTPSGVCWENPFPTASIVGFDALASTAAGTVAVGSGGNILLMRGDDLDLLEPTGHDLNAVLAVSESHAFVAGERGYLADLNLGDGSLSVKERAFPDSPTGPIFSIAALGTERVFLSSLHGAITEWTPQGYVDRSVRSSSAGTSLAQTGAEVVASYGHRVSSLESARDSWTEAFAMPIRRTIVVDGVRAFALGEQGALYERGAAGWSTALERPAMVSRATTFQDVAIVHRADRTPLVVVAMGLGKVFVREGFHEDGGTFEEEVVPWAAGPGVHLHRLAVLDDGTVLGVGSILAVRSPDGTWRGERQSGSSYYAVVRSGPSEAWAAGNTGQLARYFGGRWETYKRAVVTGKIVSLAESATVPGEIHGMTRSGEWLVRSVDGTLRREELPSADVWRSLIALPDGRFVAGGDGKALFRQGDEFRIQDLPGSTVLCLASYGGTIVFADGNAVFELTPSGAVRLVELPSMPYVEEPLTISALFSTTNADGDELFIGTTSLGVYRFANGRLTVVKPVEFEGPRDDRRLLNDQIVSFSSGPSGFYAATALGEILRRTGARRFSRVPKEPRLAGDQVSALLDASGTLYAIGRAVWRLEDGRFTVVRTGAIQLESGIALPSGDVLVGGFAGTLIRIPAPTSRIR